MLSNLEAADDLRGLARIRSRDSVTKTVKPTSAENLIAQGWQVTRRTRKSWSLRKPKATSTWLEDRVWILLYRTGFQYLSGEGGANIEIRTNEGASSVIRIPIVGIDSEVAVAFACITGEPQEIGNQLSHALENLKVIRSTFARVINQQYPILPLKRQTAIAIVTPNDSLSEGDKLQAASAGITVLEARDLDYYTELTSHLGPAAKYQLLADLLPGKPIPGLKIRVPAVKAKMGSYTCYTFCMTPEYLLKIGYVSHRSRGTTSDVGSYQRMIKKSRLAAIQKFLDEDDAIFPTNIVVNIDRSRLTFQRQQQDTDQHNGVMGWLDIRPSYKSAWIIDGQHRLFAYSGHPKATTSKLTILAFESLPPEKQANLFIDINAQQRSVKQSLLQDLYSVFHWNAQLEKDRVAAIVSRAIHELNTDRGSPFHQRIPSSDEKKDAVRCITMQSIFDPLVKRPELFVGSGKNEGNYGPLWVEGSNEATLKRTVHILKLWFENIRNSAKDWWDAGKGEGGGLAMNDSVTALIMVLKSVLLHVEAEDPSVNETSDEELWQRLHTYATAVATYIGSLTPDERRDFRLLRGIQGQTARMRQCQKAINEQMPNFNPDGLDEYMKEQRAQTNVRAKAITDVIELMLQRTVIEELQREFGSEESQWWMEGVPRGIRQKVSNVYEDDAGARGKKEAYFDLLDYRRIIMDNWTVFADLLGEGKPNASKEKRTAWIDEVNECRKVVAHPSSGKIVSVQQLARLQDLETWLNRKVSGKPEQGLSSIE